MPSRLRDGQNGPVGSETRSLMRDHTETQWGRRLLDRGPIRGSARW